MKSTKKLAICSILTALILVLLYFASVFPVLSLSLIAIAGLLPAVAIIECGLSYGTTMYIASVILTLLLAPDKQCAILYTVLFGDYPIIKYFAEQIHIRWLMWGIKFVVVNSLMLGLYFIFNSVFFAFIPSEMLLWISFATFNIIFIMYDLCFTRLTTFYMVRIHHHIV